MVLRPPTTLDASDKTQLERYMRELWSDQRRQDTDFQNGLAQVKNAMGSANPATPALTLAAIQAALQEHGSNPLNVTGLLGLLAESQRGFAVVAASAGALPKPDTYAVGTLGAVVSGTTISIYMVVAGNPRTWQLVTIGSGSVPTDMMTTDTDQNPITGKKTFTADQTFATMLLTGKITKYSNLSTAGMGVSPILVDTSLTGQTVAIGSTSLLASAPNGKYRLSYYLYLTTLGNNVNLTATFGWNDGVGGYSIASAVVPCNTPGFAQGVITFRSGGSSNITYSTGLTGAIGTGVYALDMELERLS